MILEFLVSALDDVIETADQPRFLSVASVAQGVVVWAEATPGAGVRTSLQVTFAGQLVPDAEGYIGTAVQSDGTAVHVYWRPA